jgi:glycosyltransferase involved in cell wall biosynthesis
MRICLLSYMISNRATGLSSYIAGVVNRLVDAGNEVTVLATDSGYRGAAAGDLMKIDDRARLIVFPIRGRVNRRIYRCSALANWLREHSNEFDILDIQGVWAVVNIQALQAVIATGLPYVLTPHGMLTRWDWSKRTIYKKVLFKIGIGKLIANASCIRFLSVGEEQSSATPTSGRTIVIPNAVIAHNGPKEENAKVSVCSQLGIPAKNKIVLFVGRVSRQKGALELIQAVELLYHIRKDISLILVGPNEEGAYGNLVKKTIEVSPARENIHLIGPIFNAQKFAFYVVADLFVTLSRNEGLSLAALESLAEGLPVMITPDSNLPEVAKYGAGLITACEPKAACEAMVGYFASGEKLKQMRQASIRLHREKFSWEVVLPRLENLYRSVAELSDYAANDFVD